MKRGQSISAAPSSERSFQTEIMIAVAQLLFELATQLGFGALTQNVFFTLQDFPRRRQFFAHFRQADGDLFRRWTQCRVLCSNVACARHRLTMGER